MIVLTPEDPIGPQDSDFVVIHQHSNFNWCYETIQLVSWTEQGWDFSPETGDYPCASTVDLETGDDGTKQVVVVGSRYCYIGFCQYWRMRRVTFTITGDELVQTGDELVPSSYRFHVLEDGEIAMARGDLEAAVGIYNRAATDSSLVDAPTINQRELQNEEDLSMEAILERAHAYQTSFAYFREYSLLFYLGRDDKAVEIMSTMKKLYPEGSPGSEFVDLASYLAEQIGSGLSVSGACEATNAYLEDRYVRGRPQDFIWRNLIQWDDYQLQSGYELCPELGPN